MTRDGDGPRKDDRVRVVLDGRYVRESDLEDHDGGFAGCFVDVDGVLLYVPPSATVEVLERADDPSKDPEGTQRLVEYDCEPARVFTASEDGAFDNRWVALNGATYSDAEIAGSKVIGAYPGTPAAEAARDKAVADALPDWERDLVAAGQTREPRVFKSDGPEPPADVENLEVVEFEWTSHVKYLRRGRLGWYFTDSLDEEANKQGFQWPPASEGRFREVLS